MGVSHSRLGPGPRLQGRQVQEPDSFSRRGGRSSPGLHKRSAEDKGGSCRAPGTESLRKAWFPCLSALWRAEEIALCLGRVPILRGTAKPNRDSAVGGLPRIVETRLSRTYSAEMRTVLMLLVLCFAGHAVAQQPVSRFLRSHYKAADGTWVRRPRIYKRARARNNRQQPAATDH